MQSTEETLSHLFVNCSMATMCWNIIGMDIPLNGSFPELVSQLKTQLNSPFFMDAIILMCWTIWTARNELIFKGNQMNLADCKRVFFKELSLLQYRVKSSQAEQFTSWIQSLAWGASMSSFFSFLFFLFLELVAFCLLLPSSFVLSVTSYVFQ